MEKDSQKEATLLVTLTCMVCGVKYEGEEPKMCCSGRDCGCMGLPIYPVVCSERCYNNLPFRKSSTTTRKE